MALDPLLEQSGRRPPLRELAKAHRLSRPSRWQRWLSSKVTGFRVGQTAVYIGIAFAGTSAFVAGIPVFVFTAPEHWTPVWAAILVVGAVVASLGSASEETAFEAVELVGAWLMFLTLGCYAAVLLIIGYGQADNARASIGALIFALALAPGVRMVWLMSQIPSWKAELKARRSAKAYPPIVDGVEYS